MQADTVAIATGGFSNRREQLVSAVCNADRQLLRSTATNLLGVP
jgi:hypothetical protein